MNMFLADGVDIVYREENRFLDKEGVLTEVLAKKESSVLRIISDLRELQIK